MFSYYKKAQANNLERQVRCKACLDSGVCYVRPHGDKESRVFIRCSDCDSCYSDYWSELPIYTFDCGTIESMPSLKIGSIGSLKNLSMKWKTKIKESIEYWKNYDQKGGKTKQ